jgi:integrase
MEKYSIRFNLKRKKGTMSAVNAVVRIDGKKTVLPTGISVLIDDWSVKKERCKKDTEKNYLLGEVRKFIETQVKRGQKLRKPGGTESVIEAVRERGEKIAANGNIKSGRQYETLAQNLIRYQEEKEIKCPSVGKVSQEYVQGFVHFLMKKNVANSHICKQVKSLITIVRRYGFNETVEKPQNKFQEKIYLTPKEIQKIAEVKDLSEENERIKDVFLIACYTALRFSDLAEGVRKDGFLHVIQKKTGQKVVLPISEKLERILDKYERVPRICNQYFNREIKKIAEKAGVTELVGITSYRGGKMIREEKRKCDIISSHTGRRSFATNAINAGIPHTHVMKFTGHRSMNAFMSYIRSDAQVSAILYQDHDFFK